VAVSLYRSILDRLRAFTVLDPACGSGNFLYLALRALKDLENRVMIEAEALGLQRELTAIGPGSVKGIEINPYAAWLYVQGLNRLMRNGRRLQRLHHCRTSSSNEASAATTTRALPRLASLQNSSVRGRPEVDFPPDIPAAASHGGDLKRASRCFEEPPPSPAAKSQDRQSREHPPMLRYRFPSAPPDCG
jgi:hypothetical protein